ALAGWCCCAVAAWSWCCPFGAVGGGEPVDDVVQVHPDAEADDVGAGADESLADGADRFASGAHDAAPGELGSHDAAAVMAIPDPRQGVNFGPWRVSFP